MLFLTESIGYNIGFTWMIMYFKVIVLYQFQPFSLSHVQLGLSEYVFEALMVSVNVT